jgi:uncharacterized protein (TIGR04255 family)
MTSSIVCLTVARERNLANAPITEAIIDFRVKHTQGFQVEKFLTLKAELASEFPIVEPRTIVEGAFEIKIGEPIEAKKREELQGYWFKSTDGFNSEAMVLRSTDSGRIPVGKKSFRTHGDYGNFMPGPEPRNL